MSRGKGAIIVNEIIVPITEISLQGGTINFRGTLHGPVPAVDSASYVVTGEDGGVVFRTDGLRGRGRLSWSAIPAGGYLTVHCPLVVDHHQAIAVTGRPWRRKAAL